MIRLDNIAWQAGTFDLRNISLTVPAGRYGVLMGRTGAGKTSLLKAMLNLVPRAAGDVLLDGAPVRRRSSSPLSRYTRRLLRGRPVERARRLGQGV